MALRLVGGSHRGRALEAPPGAAVRPTASRAREALFNILEHGSFGPGGASAVPGAVVLDAFAGSGALGLEALSRGAAFATFIETDGVVAACLARNLRRLGEEHRARLVRGDAVQPPPAPQPVTLAFLDPPYRSGLALPALAALRSRGWIGGDTLAVVETSASETLAWPAGFERLDERRYGAALVTFLKTKRGEPEGSPLST